MYSQTQNFPRDFQIFATIKQMAKNKKTKNIAFTLIELLVTIVIIGILATISVGSFNGYIRKAHNAKTLNKIQQIKKAAILHQIETGAWSPDIAPSNGCPCLNQNHNLPQFILDRFYSKDEFENLQWNGKPACIDWQNWPGNNQPVHFKVIQCDENGSGTHDVITVCIDMKGGSAPCTDTIPSP